MLLLAAPASAQGLDPREAPGETENTTENTTESATGAETEPVVRDVLGAKVAVIVVGDPDDRMRSLARRIDEALEPTLRRPFDPGLRAALRGDPGQDDDGLEEVRRDRRRLGAGESRDAPIVSSLARRAGALVVALVRHGDEGPELVMVDVRSAAYYEGAMPLSGTATDERILAFVTRRARASQRRVAVDPELVAEQAPVDETTPAEPEEEEEPDFFEQYWPYFVAAALLAGMIAAIAATSATDGSSQPVLRFVPGGR